MYRFYSNTENGYVRINIQARTCNIIEINEVYITGTQERSSYLYIAKFDSSSITYCAKHDIVNSTNLKIVYDDTYVYIQIPSFFSFGATCKDYFPNISYDFVSSTSATNEPVNV